MHIFYEYIWKSVYFWPQIQILVSWSLCSRPSPGPRESLSKSITWDYIEFNATACCVVVRLGYAGLPSQNWAGDTHIFTRSHATNRLSHAENEKSRNSLSLIVFNSQSCILSIQLQLAHTRNARFPRNYYSCILISFLFVSIGLINKLEI